MDRIITLVDMDCFYVQVEQRLCPELFGKPCAVVQGSGGVLSANYEARAFGLKKGILNEKVAKQKCPEVHIFRVPELRGKPNLTRYRDASAEVMEVLNQFSECMERASIDEAYLDLTDIVKKRLNREVCFDVTSQLIANTFVVGWEKSVENETSCDQETDSRTAALTDWLRSSCSHNENDRLLAVAAVVIEEMRATVYEKTGFRCSAGIAHNKVLAKLSCGLHKPNCQTVLPRASVPGLFKTISINKVRSLGGKLGNEVKEKLGIETMFELSQVKETQLQKLFGEKNGSILFQLGQGIDTDPVKPRQLAKSIGCGKNFYGGLKTKSEVTHWVGEFCEELEERLNKDLQSNNRVARSLCISVRRLGETGSTARSCPLQLYDSKTLAKDCLAILQKFNTAPPNTDKWFPAFYNIAISASKFQDKLDSSSNITSFFTKSTPMELIQPHLEEDTIKHTDTEVQLVGEKSYNENSTTLSAISIPSTSTCPSKKYPEIFTNSGFFARKVVDVKPKIPNSNSDFPEIRIQKLIYSLTNDQILAKIPINEENKANQILVKETEDQQALENEFSYQCEHCSCNVSFQDMEEHTDFHFAQKLQEQFSVKKTMPSNKLSPKSSNKKRKLTSRKNINDKKTKVNMKPLEFYMK